MIDTHCHLNLDPLNQDVSGHLKHAKDAGVTDLIIPGVNRQSSQAAIDLASKHDHLYAAIGLHPHEADQVLTDGTDLDALTDWLIKQAKSNPKVVAIGECGLDYYRLEDGKQRKHSIAAQKKLFRLHLHAARQAKVPVSVHVRDAQTDALNILSRAKVRGVLHCFSGDQDYLQAALDLGLYISFAGNVTFKGSKDLQHLLILVPKDRLLLETDAPFLNPHRGHWPNTPSNISLTYAFVADLLHMDQTKLSDLVHQNARELFRL